MYRFLCTRWTAAWVLLFGAFVSLPVAAQGEVTLEVMHRWSGDRHPLLRAVLDQFEADHPGVTIKDQQVGGALNERLVTAWLAGVGPDVAMVNLGSSPEFGVRGFLAPIEGFIRADGATLESLIYPRIAEAIRVDGVAYYLPMTINLGRHLLYFNRRMFSEAGLDPDAPPRAHSAWFETAQRLTRLGPDGTYLQRGIDLIADTNARNARMWESLIEQWGVGAFDVSSRTALPDVARAISVAEWMLEFNQGLGGILGSGAGEARPPFENEDVAMYMGIDGDWFIFTQRVPDLDLAVAPLPAPDGEPLRSALVAGWGWGISSDTDQPELAWELVKWLSIAPEGGGWFMRQQGRMSSSPEANSTAATSRCIRTGMS